MLYAKLVEYIPKMLFWTHRPTQIQTFIASDKERWNNFTLLLKTSLHQMFIRTVKNCQCRIRQLPLPSQTALTHRHNIQQNGQLQQWKNFFIFVNRQEHPIENKE